MTQRTFDRRIFLRGLGGAVVAAPFLSSVAERAAKAQGVPAGDPRRAIFMFTHYGAFTKTWFPASSHGPLDAAALAPTSLKDLGPHAAKLMLPRGIRAMNEWSFQATLGQINDPHTQVCGSFFSCYPVSPNGVATGGGLPSDEAKFHATPLDRTFDHTVAEQISPKGTPLFIRISGRNDSEQSAISYSDGKGTMYQGVGKASDVFNELTKLYGSGGSSNEDTAAVAKGKAVMDLIGHDLDSLSMKVMSADDKKKLSDWKDLLNDVTTGVRAECSEASATKLMLSSQAVGASASDITAGITKTFNSLVTLAAVCDANRMMVLKYPASYVFSGLGIKNDAHGLSHRQGDAFMGGNPCVANVNDLLQQIDVWYAQMFADLVAKLDSFAEGTGTVLDNSAAVYFQEMSDGNSHNLNNLPIIHAGSCGGYFKTGQIINCEDGKTANMTPGSSDAACANGGTVPTNVDGTGTPSNIANAPINKYFVNIMNALGVKADSTGWAKKGGTEEVKNFGKYDDSKLFADGGTAPAKINSPGGFDYLKA